MKRALLIGIDHYEKNPLQGCIKDAIELAEVLSENKDKSPNYDCHVLVSREKNEKDLCPKCPAKADNTLPPHSTKQYVDDKSPLAQNDIKPAQVTVAQVQKELDLILRAEADEVIFYFSGHGSLKNSDGYLVTQDTEKFDPGFPISRLIRQINNATHINEITVILDCCHSGASGSLSDFGKDHTILRRGVSILAASQANGYARMNNNRSVFTNILIDGLKGAAADLLGNVSVHDIYGYADKVLGPWDQRPLLISHVSRIRPLRNAKSRLTSVMIRKICEYFPEEKFKYELKDFYIEEKQGDKKVKKKNPDKKSDFKTLNKFFHAGLIKPIKSKTLKGAARNSKYCKLSSTGKAYWRMVTKDKI